MSCPRCGCEKLAFCVLNQALPVVLPGVWVSYEFCSVWSCPEQDVKLLRRVRRRKHLCCDVVINRAMRSPVQHAAAKWGGEVAGSQRYVAGHLLRRRHLPKQATGHGSTPLPGGLERSTHPEHDAKLFRQVRRGMWLCTYCDVVISRSGETAPRAPGRQ